MSDPIGERLRSTAEAFLDNDPTVTAEERKERFAALLETAHEAVGDGLETARVPHWQPGDGLSPERAMMLLNAVRDYDIAEHEATLLQRVNEFFTEGSQPEPAPGSWQGQKVDYQARRMAEVAAWIAGDEAPEPVRGAAQPAQFTLERSVAEGYPALDTGALHIQAFADSLAIATKESGQEIWFDFPPDDYINVRYEQDGAAHRLLGERIDVVGADGTTFHLLGNRELEPDRPYAAVVREGEAVLLFAEADRTEVLGDPAALEVLLDGLDAPRDVYDIGADGTSLVKRPPAPE